MIVATMGLIGSGKSTLAKALHKKYGFVPFIEPTKESEGADNNPFLDDYYDRYTGLYLKSKKLLKNINKVS